MRQFIALYQDNQKEKINMSVINFVCNNEQKEEVKAGVWEIIREHYLSTVFPNSNVEFEYEGKNAYRPRMEELMKSELCRLEDTEDGLTVDFDSTEDAGMSIAASVYGTGMGYSDQGLTYLFPVFKKIAEKFPGICFEADTECIDKWVEAYNHFSYNGSMLTVDGIDVKKYDLVMKHMSPFADPEQIAEETGLSVQDVTEIIETFC